MSDNKLCLEGDLAKPFMNHKVGDRVPLKLDAVVISVAMRPDYGEAVPSSSKKEPEKKPYVEFVLRSVNGKEGGKETDEGGDDEDYANMSSEKFEKKVAKNRGYSGNG